MQSRFLADLERRANPERSRRFSNEQFEQGLKALTDLTAALTSTEGYSFQPDLRVSVVGTNGKGTFAFALESLFRHAYGGAASTGLFTSPHLMNFNERIRLNGRPASTEELGELYEQLVNGPLSCTGTSSTGAAHLFAQSVAQSIAHRDVFDALTYFELLTLLALLLFAKKRASVQIFEAGLGGRLDATRIAEADVVVLTSVGLDHTALLGRTRRQIFNEKMGILTKRARLLFLPDDSWLKYLKPASGLEVRVLPLFDGEVDRLYSPKNDRQDDGPHNYLHRGVAAARFVYDVLRKEWLTLPPSLPDLRSFAVSVPPGRLEERTVRGHRWIFDNAHNASAIFTLLQDIDLPASNTAVVLALSLDRRPAPILRLLARRGFARLIFVEDAAFQPVDLPLFQRLVGGTPLHTLRMDAPPVDTISGETMPPSPANRGTQPNTTLRDLHAIPESNILFMGSHRLYDLFDRGSRFRSDEQR